MLILKKIDLPLAYEHERICTGKSIAQLSINSSKIVW